MKILTIFFVFILISTNLLACNVDKNFKAPELKEVFLKSKHVFRGKILSRKLVSMSKDEMSAKYLIKFKVSKSFKETKIEEVELTTESSSCDKFGIVAFGGSECLVFSNSKNEILSGTLNGFASVCELPNSIKKGSLLKDKESKIEAAKWKM